MILLRSKSYSGASEGLPAGVSYYSGQVLSDYVLDPIDRTATTLEEYRVVKNNKRLKDKLGKIRGIIIPVKKLINNKDGKS